MSQHNQEPEPGVNGGNDTVVIENLRKIAATNSLAAAYLEIYDHARSSDKFAGVRSSVQDGAYISGSRGSARGGGLPLLVPPEKLADAWEDSYGRRGWWLELHTTHDLRVGTTIVDIDAVVDTVQKATGSRSGDGVAREAEISSIQTAPVSLMFPVCQCSSPFPSLKPFDWQCAKCKGVLAPTNAREYLEAL